MDTFEYNNSLQLALSKFTGGPEGQQVGMCIAHVYVQNLSDRNLVCMIQKWKSFWYMFYQD